MSPSLERCWPQIYRFALSLTRDVHLAEDLTQDTMARACDRVHQLHDHAALRSWLLRIAANLWQDGHRRRAAMPRTEVLDDTDVMSPAPDGGRQEDVKHVLEVLQSLPPQQRAVLHLYAVDGQSVPEIAQILDMNPTLPASTFASQGGPCGSSCPNFGSK